MGRLSDSLLRMMPTLDEASAPVLTSNGVGASPVAIRTHYDLGEEFFSLWLDPSLTYSCGWWDADQDDLHLAQLRKLDFIISCGSPAQRLLDVGCGWGSLISRATSHHGVAQAVGLTLSSAQRAHVERVGDSRVQVFEQSWRDHGATSAYGAVTCVGAFEHFAGSGASEADRAREYSQFFERAHDWLEPRGRLILQTIVADDIFMAKAADDTALSRFFYEEVFPESSLPRMPEVLAAADPFFRIELVRLDGEHYARTCRAWRGNLLGNKASAEAAAGPATVAHFVRYLGLAEMSFRFGAASLLRVVMQRRQRAIPRSGRA